MTTTTTMRRRSNWFRQFLDSYWSDVEITTPFYDRVDHAVRLTMAAAFNGTILFFTNQTIMPKRFMGIVPLIAFEPLELTVGDCIINIPLLWRSAIVGTLLGLLGAFLLRHALAVSVTLYLCLFPLMAGCAALIVALCRWIPQNLNGMTTVVALFGFADGVTDWTFSYRFLLTVTFGMSTSIVFKWLPLPKLPFLSTEVGKRTASSTTTTSTTTMMGGLLSSCGLSSSYCGGCCHHHHSHGCCFESALAVTQIQRHIDRGRRIVATIILTLSETAIVVEPTTTMSTMSSKKDRQCQQEQISTIRALLHNLKHEIIPKIDRAQPAANAELRFWYLPTKIRRGAAGGGVDLTVTTIEEWVELFRSVLSTSQFLLSLISISYDDIDEHQHDDGGNFENGGFTVGVMDFTKADDHNNVTTTDDNRIGENLVSTDVGKKMTHPMDHDRNSVLRNSFQRYLAMPIHSLAQALASTLLVQIDDVDPNYNNDDFTTKVIAKIIQRVEQAQAELEVALSDHRFDLFYSGTNTTDGSSDVDGMVRMTSYCPITSPASTFGSSSSFFENDVDRSIEVGLTECHNSDDVTNPTVVRRWSSFVRGVAFVHGFLRLTAAIVPVYQSWKDTVSDTDDSNDDDDNKNKAKAGNGSGGRGRNTDHDNNGKRNVTPSSYGCCDVHSGAAGIARYVRDLISDVLLAGIRWDRPFDVQSTETLHYSLSFAFQVAAATLWYAIPGLDNTMGDNGLFVSITTCFIAVGKFGQSFQKSVQRLLGTAIATIWAMFVVVMSRLSTQQAMNATYLYILFCLMILDRQRPYTMDCAGFTAFIFLFPDVPFGTKEDFLLALTFRIAQVGIGILQFIAFQMALFRSSSRVWVEKQCHSTYIQLVDEVMDRMLDFSSQLRTEDPTVSDSDGDVYSSESTHQTRKEIIEKMASAVRLCTSSTAAANDNLVAAVEEPGPKIDVKSPFPADQYRTLLSMQDQINSMLSQILDAFRAMMEHPEKDQSRLVYRTELDVLHRMITSIAVPIKHLAKLLHQPPTIDGTTPTPTPTAYEKDTDTKYFLFRLRAFTRAGLDQIQCIQSGFSQLHQYAVQMEATHKGEMVEQSFVLQLCAVTWSLRQICLRFQRSSEALHSIAATQVSFVDSLVLKSGSNASIRPEGQRARRRSNMEGQNSNEDSSPV